MADYFVASGGSNTAPYDTWAKAATSLTTAFSNATAAGDRIILQYDGVPAVDAEVSADTSYSFSGNIELICSTNSGTSTVTPTAMGTTYWIGNSTTNYSISLSCNIRTVRVYGLTIRTAGSVLDSINISGTSTCSTFESCYFWHGNTNTGSSINILSTANTNSECHITLKGCTFRFGATAQGLGTSTGRTVFEQCDVTSAGSIPTQLWLTSGGQAGSTQGTIECYGCDWSQITGTLIGDTTVGGRNVTFSQCKFGSGVTVMAAQTTVPNRAGVDVYVFDCASGDEHYHFQHHNAFGSLTTDTGVYVTSDGAAYDTVPNRASWKIVTTANASFRQPYISPWIPVYHSGTSAITPYLEGVVTTTAPKNDEIWAEFLYKGTTGFTIGTFDQSDRRGLGATAADQTASSLGAGDWTGEPASPQFFKLSPTSTITPAEIGDLTARICVGKASTTYYIDPNIRGTGYTPSLSRVTVNGFRQELQSGTATPDVFLGGSSL